MLAPDFDRHSRSMTKVRTETEMRAFEDGKIAGLDQMSRLLRDIMDGREVTYEPAHQIFNTISKWNKKQYDKNYDPCHYHLKMHDNYGIQLIDGRFEKYKEAQSAVNILLKENLGVRIIIVQCEPVCLFRSG